jgi:hypothetical protein
MKEVFTQMLIHKKSVGFLQRPGGHAQERAVSNTVRDESGQPLSGAGLVKLNQI